MAFEVVHQSSGEGCGVFRSYADAAQAAREESGMAPGETFEVWQIADDECQTRVCRHCTKVVFPEWCDVPGESREFREFKPF